MSVNFTKYQEEITNAWRKVVDNSKTQNWALFGYEGNNNIIKLTSTGSEGLDELVQEFNCSLIQYALCRVIDEELGLNKIVLINWQGDSAPLSRKGLCASHVGDVTNYFKGCTQTIIIRNDDEATREHLMEQIVKISGPRVNLSKQKKNSYSNVDNGHVDDSTSSTIQRKVDISSEIAASRKSFWQRQEEEEKERLAEEKKRAAERQAQFEKERKQREELEAKKLTEIIKERDRVIDANKMAEKSSVSQPDSVLSSKYPDDEARVGRRSELIRLERNQETQSLISKGLIKTKRAIFEQAQLQQQSQQPNISRRSGGIIVAKRLNAFKHVENNTSTSSSRTDTTNTISTEGVDKLAHTLTEKVNITNDDSMHVSSLTPTKEDFAAHETSPVSDKNNLSQQSESVIRSFAVESNLDESNNDSAVSQISNEKSSENEATIDLSQDVNGNSENSFTKKSPNDTVTSEVISNEELIMNGKSSNIKATALFDYQAADNTEISFDPDDKIGHIQKVDPGWWHGLVMTGRFKGQVGLFPANYVQELES